MRLYLFQVLYKINAYNNNGEYVGDGTKYEKANWKRGPYVLDGDFVRGLVGTLEALLLMLMIDNVKIRACHTRLKYHE